MTLSEIHSTKNPEKLHQLWSESQHGNLQLLSLIADQFYKIGLIEEALRCYLSISVNHPRFIPNLQKIASIYKDLGQIENAHAALQSILKIDNNNLFALKTLVSISEYRKPKNHHTKRLQAILKNKQLGSDNHDLVYNTLGHIYDKCGQFEQAFEYFHLAKKHVQPDITFDSQVFSTQVDRTIEAFDKSWFAKNVHPTKDKLPKNPLFIVGPSRTGKTLLERILTKTDGIFEGHENTGYTQTISQIVRDELEGTTPYPESIRNYPASVKKRIQTEYTQIWHYQAAADNTLITDSNPWNLWHLGLIATAFPDAKIIFSKRDLMDTALYIFMKIYLGQHGYTHTLKNIAHYLIDYYRLHQHWQSVLPNPTFIYHYEDMVRQPQKTVDAIFDFINIDEVTPYVNQQNNFKVNQDLIGHWKNYRSHLNHIQSVFK